MILPLAQGMVWTLALHGIRYWNRETKLCGNTVGAGVRRWWYRTNHWPIKQSWKQMGKDKKLADEMGDVSWSLNVPGFTDVM